MEVGTGSGGGGQEVGVTHVVLPGIRLQHRRQEAVWESEAGEPEECGWGYSRRPAGKLLHPLAQVTGPGGQRLQRGVRLAVGERHGAVKVRGQRVTAFFCHGFVTF